MTSMWSSALVKFCDLDVVVRLLVELHDPVLVLIHLLFELLQLDVRLVSLMVSLKDHFFRILLTHDAV